MRCRKIKKPFIPTVRDERKPSAVPPVIHTGSSACTFHLITETTRPHISLRKLPGEQNDTYRTGFQPLADPLCCMQTRLFSHSTLVPYIYNIEKDRMQEGIEAGRKSTAGMRYTSRIRPPPLRCFFECSTPLYSDRGAAHTCRISSVRLLIPPSVVLPRPYI